MMNRHFQAHGSHKSVKHNAKHGNMVIAEHSPGLDPLPEWGIAVTRLWIVVCELVVCGPQACRLPANRT